MTFPRKKGLYFEFRTPVPRVFRFLNRQFMDAFFKTGSLRLNTLRDLQNEETHGLARGDSAEGQRTLVRNQKGRLLITSESNEPLISKWCKVDPGATAVLEDNVIWEEERSTDLFIYCTSDRFTPSLFERWHHETEASIDACIEIVDPRGFATAINKAIAHSAFFWRHANVIYATQAIDYRSPLAREHPSLFKQEGPYGWQHEHRFIWAPHLPFQPLQPWIIDVPEARKFCRPFATLNNGQISYLP